MAIVSNKQTALVSFSQMQAHTHANRCTDLPSTSPLVHNSGNSLAINLEFILHRQDGQFVLRKNEATTNIRIFCVLALS